MLKYLTKVIQYPLKSFRYKFKTNQFSFWNRLVMASESGKSELNLTSKSPPTKKMKVDNDSEVKEVLTRTVATMCGAWRPEEVDGGLILVFKTREACLSPDPTQESDYPENIQDFWEASLMAVDNDQITEIKPDGARRTELLKQTKEIQTPKQIQTPVSMKRTSVLYGSPV